MKLRRKEMRWALPTVTIGLLLLIAGMATASMWVMHNLHNRMAHRDATMAVVDTGRLITSGLARHMVDHPELDPINNWPYFSHLVKVLASSEDQLQYVSVVRDDVTVFHENLRPLVGDANLVWPEQVAPDLVVPSRELLTMGTNRLPMMVFSLPFEDANGEEYELSVGLRKGAIEREEQVAAKNMRLLFRLTTVTISVSFGTTILVIIWMFFREEQQDRRRRSEEHLAYAGVMASGIVHDFRNPMSSLRLDVQMLRKQAAKGAACDMGRVKSLSERICSITERMEKVFQEFLFISRPGASEQEILNVSTLLQDCIAVAQPRMDVAGVHVELCDVDHDVKVLAHAEALRRAVLNLLINAEQHAGRNGRVLVQLVCEKRMALIYIANTGDAVSRSERKKIFELFYTTRPGGTGLGLFLARAALQQIRGRIELDEREGFATCFRVELPLNESWTGGT